MTGTLIGAGVAVWAFVKKLPGPVDVVLGLLAFVLASAAVRLWRAPHVAMLSPQAKPPLDRKELPTERPVTGAAPLVDDLTNSPKVVVSHGVSGIELIVEPLDFDVANIRLVARESTNYRLTSEVIRHLKKGQKALLILHCEQIHKGSSVLQQFSAPFLFFDDFFPPLTGDTDHEILEQAMTQFFERQIAVDVEIAYSTVSVAEHFRTKVKIRYENFNNSVVDVEMVGMRRDNAPPPTNPHNVIRTTQSRLEFLTWHGAGTRALPKIAEGKATWIAVKNAVGENPLTAKGVTATIRFSNSTKTTVLTVPEAIWWARFTSQRGDMHEGWSDGPSIGASEEQSFAFYVSSDGNEHFVYKYPQTLVGMLEPGRWEAQIVVSSDNIEGFEGVIKFLLTRDTLQYDTPAFVMQRTVAPRLRSR